MPDTYAVAAAQLAKAIVDTVRDSEPHGAPGGILYAALMSYGFSLDTFERLMSALVRLNMLRKEGHIYHIVGVK